ncbi:MAG: hypothetical protein ACJ70N_08040, partial [Nitrososphaera sp.]
KASGRVLATVVRNNTVDEGISAFTLWLGENEDFAKMPITMRHFTQGIDKVVVVSLQDNILRRYVTVDVVEGVPFCNECKSNDCAHVGFAVCAEQMNLRSKLE